MHARRLIQRSRSLVRFRQLYQLVVILLALATLGQLAWARRESVPSSVAKAQRTRQIRRDVQERGLRSAAVNQSFVRRHQSGYAVKVPQAPIRDQEKSGRCWAFAWTRTLQSMAQSKGQDTGALSPSFINYYALRDLAHGAIDHARRGASKPEHHTYYLDGDMLGEGGYSHWANTIVKRHGIVPETKMRSNTYDSRESSVLQNQLHRLVTAATRDIWRGEKTARERRAIATKYKKQVDQLLDTMIGAPPKRFTIDGKTYTPKSYLKDYMKLANEDLQFVNLTNDPSRAWNRRYRESFAGKGIPENETYNVSMSTMQHAVKQTLKSGVAVNVAVNVDWDNPHRVAPQGSRSSDANGILSLKAFRYGKLVPTAKLSRRDRMGHYVSMSNHMMAITGYNPGGKGKEARWLIDNSHGKDTFRGGRFDMYDDYFRNYVEEVTVPRGMLPKSVLKKIEGKPALDSISGMTPPPSKGGDRWTPSRRRAMVQALMREELSISEAAQRYNVPATQVKKWYDTAKKAMLNSLR